MFIDSKEAMENSIYLKSVPLVFENHGSKLLKVSKLIDFIFNACSLNEYLKYL